MKLAGLRKFAVSKHLKVVFGLPNGLECVIDERGVARVPALKGVPDFNLEDQLASVREFRLEPTAAGKEAVQSRVVSWEELEAMTASGPRTEAAHEED